MEELGFNDYQVLASKTRKEFDDVDEYEAGEKIRSWIEQG